MIPPAPEPSEALRFSEQLHDAREPVDSIDMRQRRAALFANLFDEDAPPITIDRFVVIEPIGVGAMGRVYRARDPQLDRDVAIKLVRRELLEGDGSEPRHHARMMEEARALAQLDHPNVVSIYEVGEVHGGVFIAMQYVQGPTLRRWLDRSPRTWSQIVQVFLGAARGLAAAHAAGLVHRDFKPANVFISADDQEVLVGDFGLARIHTSSRTDAEGSVSTSAESTATGTVVGTPAYMAPEQHRGEPLDGRADQYAFGVALHEAIYGRRPRSSRPARRAGVPRWLAEVVGRTLAPEPDDRFADMHGVIEALGRDRRAIVRRRLLVSGLAVSIGVSAWLGLGGLAADDPCAVEREQIDMVLDQSSRERLRTQLLASREPYAEASAATVDRALLRYAERWTQVRTESCEATWVHHAQSSELFDRRTRCLDERVAAAESLMVQVAATDEVSVDRVVSATFGLPRIEACSDRERMLATVPLPEDPAVAKRVQTLERRLTEAKTLGELGHFERALEQTRALALEAEEVDHPVLLADVLAAVAHLHRERSELEQAVSVMERALHESLAAGHDAQTIKILASLAYDVGYGQERTEQGRRWLGQARAMLRHVGDLPELAASLHNDDGTLSLVEGRPERALPAFELALARTIEAWGPQHPHVGGVHLNLGNTNVALDDPAKALEHYDAAIDVWTALFGEQHPAVANSLMGRGEALTALERFDAAQEAFERAEAILTEVLGPQSVAVGRVLGSLGVLALSRRDATAARAYHQRSLANFESALGPDHSLVARALKQVGDTYRVQGRCDEGLPLLQRAVAIYRAHLGEHHPAQLTALLQLTWCRIELGEPERVLSLVAAADAIRAEEPDARWAEPWRSLEHRGHAQLALGDRDAALASFEEARLGAGDPEMLDPATHFHSARLLVDDDPLRARALAERSRDQWLEYRRPLEADEVTAWLERSFSPR